MAEVTRDEMQEEAANLWLESDRKNTLLLGTGFGKSRVCMLILDKLFNRKELTKDSKILLLSDSEDLRDNNWKDDFEKWDMEWLWSRVQSECYQTAYKWEDTEWDMVIADEIDFSITEEYSKVFTKNKIKTVLGLTGYVDPDKMSLLMEIAPPIMEYTTVNAQQDGILNKTQVVLVYYDLSRDKNDIKVEYVSGGKPKSFYQSENSAYEYLEKQCELSLDEIRKLNKEYHKSMGMDSGITSKLKSARHKYRMLTGKRKRLLYSGIASKKVTQALIEKLLETPRNKVLTFSMYTDQADVINECTYHGKNKKGNTALTDLSLGKVRSVGVCKAVNRGKNLIGVNCLVMESFDGSKTQFTQRHGRGCRLDADDIMYLYILLPYYYRTIDSPENPGQKVQVRRPTQMVTWAKEMVGDFNFTNPLKITRVGDEWQ